MKVPDFGRLKSETIKFSHRFMEGALILLYHRVIDLPSDPQALAVRPSYFAEHLKIIRSFGYPMSLGEMLQSRWRRKFPPRSIVITFDDGYADNLIFAKPALESVDIPATLFVASGQIGSPREFWWDELERLFLQTGTLPPTLDLEIDGQSYAWSLGETAVYDQAVYKDHQQWNVNEKNDPTPRQAIYRALCGTMHSLLPETCQDILAELRAWAGVDSMGRTTHRSLSAEELGHIASGGLIEIGAHTVSHPLLSVLPEKKQLAEMRQSKCDLESILGHSISSFSYPFGYPAAYTSQTVSMAKKVGFDQACANYDGLVWPTTDRFQLPRYLVRDWDGEEFSRRLEDWFEE